MQYLPVVILQLYLISATNSGLLNFYVVQCCYVHSSSSPVVLLGGYEPWQLFVVSVKYCVMDTHFSVPPKYICAYCQKVYSTTRIPWKTKQPPTKVCCSFCKDVVLQNIPSKVDVERLEEIEEIELPCNVCSKAVKISDTEKHAEQCGGSKQPSLVLCHFSPACDKEIEEVKLEEHESHCPHRPTKCPKCDTMTTFFKLEVLST